MGFKSVCQFVVCIQCLVAAEELVVAASFQTGCKMRRSDSGILRQPKSSIQLNKINTTQRKLKILILARFANRSGGAEVYTEGLAIHLAKLGHQVHVFCHQASSEVHANCEVTELSLIHI